MSVLINGVATDVPTGSTVADLLRQLGRDPEGKGMAVAINGEVVARTRWSHTEVGEGDRIEVLVAVQGG